MSYVFVYKYTYTYVRGVALNNIISSSPDLYYEASHKEKKRDQTSAAYLCLWLTFPKHACNKISSLWLEY